MQVKHVLATAAAATLSLVSLAANAQTQAAGLWEHSFTMKTSDGQMEKAMAEMQKQMAAMPPEQRKQMEAAMASHGVKLGPSGTTSRVCISKEQAEMPPETRMSQGECTQKDVQRSGRTMKFKFECAKPPSSVEGEVTYASDKAYTGHSTVTSQVAGKPQQMTMEMQGKWLSTDCGELKPRPTPAK
jgi:hypothetical protein